ncbi:MAG: polyprenyl synthetase family protein [Anaerolineales bacterium]|nr:polyprenyl synthetase family protein [Anaerolineales bacterium]
MNIQQAMLQKIEDELKHQVARLDQPRTKYFHEMLTYHMGWTGEGSGSEATGKRIRPLLVLLSTSSLIENEKVGDQNNASPYWLRAKSAAAAIELIHNFSLVHDDIQDNSDKRRGRNTVWVNWGAPMAINVGDALFVIANQAVMDLMEYYPAEVVVKAANILNNSCLDLTRGQFLDMSYEERHDIGIDEYWPMVGERPLPCWQSALTLARYLETPRKRSRKPTAYLAGILGLHSRYRMTFWGFGVMNRSPGNLSQATLWRERIHCRYFMAWADTASLLKDGRKDQSRLLK